MHFFVGTISETPGSCFKSQRLHRFQVFRAMIAKMLVQFLLFPCFVHAIREDSIVHRVGTRAVVITEGTAGTVPVAVNAAIRKVNGRVSRKLSLGSAFCEELTKVKHFKNRYV